MLKPREILTRWAAQGYEYVEVLDGGYCSPCKYEDIPRGRVHDYVPVASEAAVKAMEDSFSTGYTYPEDWE